MKKALLGLLLPVGLIAVLLVPQTLFIVDEKEQAIITQLGEYKRTLQEPGLHMKLPVIQTVHRYESRILVSDATPIEYLTGDKKRVVVDHITRWRIKNPLAFFKTVRTETGARARLDDIVLSELRQEIALHEFTDIISNKRDRITQAVTEAASLQGAKFGIEVLDVRIKRTDLPREVQESVFARMVAERERIAKRYRSEGEEEAVKIRAKTDKERKIILAEAYQEAQRLRGEGDAESTRIYAEAYGRDPEFYRFLRSLEAYEAGIGEGSVLVLSAEDELLQYLTGHRRSKP